MKSWHIFVVGNFVAVLNMVAAIWQHNIPAVFGWFVAAVLFLAIVMKEVGE
jgi:hypothetical protein